MFFRCLNTRALPQLRNTLLREEAKFSIYELDGKSIHDKRSLCEAFRLNVPHGRSEHASRGFSWDAFADNLAYGLQVKGDPFVAILWHDAQRLLEGNLPLLLELVEVGTAVGRDRYESDPFVVLQVFLLGDGPNFPDYPADGRVLGVGCKNPPV